MLQVSIKLKILKIFARATSSPLVKTGGYKDSFQMKCLPHLFANNIINK